MKVFIFLLSIIVIFNYNLRDDPYTKLTNVRYGNYTRNLMDIYIPNKETPPGTYGALLLIHGGNWNAGDKKDFEYYSMLFANHGYITAALNYRYVDDNTTVWAQLEDIENALKKLVEVCVPLRKIINGIALVGSSAGAHLATLFTYSIPQKSPIQIKFVVNRVGPSDFHDEYWKGSSVSEDMGTRLTIFLNAIKKDPKDIPKEELEAMMTKLSPVHYMNSNSAPTLCAYGGKDTIVPYGNRDQTLSKLKEVGIQFDLIDFPNSGHSLSDDPDMAALFQKTWFGYGLAYFGY